MAISTTHCSHGRRYTEPCAECDAHWRQTCIESLRKQAAALGFVLVPVEEVKREMPSSITQCC